MEGVVFLIVSIIVVGLILSLFGLYHSLLERVYGLMFVFVSLFCAALWFLVDVIGSLSRML